MAENYQVAHNGKQVPMSQEDAKAAFYSYGDNSTLQVTVNGTLMVYKVEGVVTGEGGLRTIKVLPVKS